MYMHLRLRPQLVGVELVAQRLAEGLNNDDNKKKKKKKTNNHTTNNNDNNDNPNNTSDIK